MSPLPAADEASPPERFARGALRGLEAASVDCAVEITDRWPERVVLCGTYGRSFSSFKAYWEEQTRRFNLPRPKPDGPWKLRGGAHERDYEVEETPLTVRFDERKGRVAIAWVPPDDTTDQAPPEPKADNGKRNRLTAGFGGVGTPRLLKESRVDPVYPEKALAEEIEGSVVLDLVIRKDGTVAEVTVLRCKPTGWGLEQAAVEAVRQWRYEPARFRGEPVEVQLTVYVEFKLPDAPPAPR